MILSANTPINSGYTGTQRPIIQNLGPGIVYIGPTSTDLTTEGLKLPVNAVYEYPAIVQDGAGAVWVVADTNSTDVRIINVG